MCRSNRRLTFFIFIAALAIAELIAFPDFAVGQTRLNGAIVFSRMTPSSDSQIFRVNADGTGEVQITAGECYRDGFPSLSPDGTQIVFVSSCPDGNDEIYTMDVDGANRRRLTTNSATDTTPVWSPDGTKIAFVSERDSGFHIFVMNIDGTAQQRLTSNAGGSDLHPAWSPDGSKLAYSRSLPGSPNPDICVINANGTGLVNLTNNAVPDYWPAWSPNGAKIAFNSLRNTTQNIYVMNADGSNETKVTSQAADSSPAWSPDGSKVVFSSIVNSNDDLFIMNPDGSGLTKITNSPLHDNFPRWQNIFAPQMKPTLITFTQNASARAVALDSVTMQREPFSVNNTYNFSSDHTTRLSLFAVYAGLKPGENSSAITVQAEDMQANIFPLSVESVGPVPTMNWITQINVKLTPGLTGEIKLSFTLRGQVSEKALVLLQ
jgi:Tol biopolymer transport system component